jgi:hypothetical protein
VSVSGLPGGAIRALLFAAAFAVAATTRASAQTVADVLTFLVTNQSVQTGSVDRDRDAAQATSDTISRALLANLATLPVTTSSGAFAYRLNPELGTSERATQTFGPFFVERSLTAGRHHASVGLSFQHLRFTSLGGSDLRDGSLITTANQFVDEAAPFDVDRLALDIDADVTTLFGNVGVTDRLEIGFAAPMIAIRLNGTRVNTYRGRAFTQANASAMAFGLADLVVRSKYTLYDDGGVGVAAAADVRLPTGRKEDLLGAGATSVRLAGIGSLERGRLSAHANAGVALGGLAREIGYGGAVAFATAPRVSMSGELLGRWLNGVGQIAAMAAPHPRLTGVETTRLVPAGSTLNIMTVVPGVKWNVTNTWVLAGSVSIPLTSDGLTSPFTPFIGLDYAFGR